jgi:hypothetical protein
MGIEGVPDYFGSWDMQLNEKIRLDCVDTFEYNMVLMRFYNCGFEKKVEEGKIKIRKNRLKSTKSIGKL